VCWARHHPGDRFLGQPLCADCYDRDHNVEWNLHAGELWRRTKQATERHLATIARQRGIPCPAAVGADGTPRRIRPVPVTHGKAAEFQTHGAVHFHTVWPEWSPLLVSADAPAPLPRVCVGPT
jgi:hypothetical protein